MEPPFQAKNMADLQKAHTYVRGQESGVRGQGSEVRVRVRVRVRITVKFRSTNIKIFLTSHPNS